MKTNRNYLNFGYFFSLFIPLIIFGCLVARLWSYTIDDSFIFYHYAQNLGAGNGLVWNIGESIPTEGFTSLLWVFILSIFSFLKINLLLVSKEIGVILILLTALIGFLQAHKRGLRIAAIAYLFLLLCSPFTVLNSISGMDTALAIFLVTLFLISILELNENPSNLQACVCGLTGLMLGLSRPEANILVVVSFLLSVFLSTHRKKIGFGLLTYTVLGVIYFLWRYQYFGLWFPLPFYIKQANVKIFAGVQNVQSFLLFMSPVLVLAILGAAWKSYKWIPAAGGVLVLLIYYLFPEHLMGMHFRYLFPLYPVTILAASFGLEKLVRKKKWAYSIFAIALVLVFTWFQFNDGRQEVKSALAYSSNLERSYVQLGRNLAIYNPDHTIALGSVGAVAYFSGWQVLDTFGLNNRTVARITDANQRVAYIWSQQPDILVLVSGDAEKMIEFHDYDRLLYETAKAQGYQYRCSYRFNDNYFLWVYTHSGLELSSFACGQ